jgi:hypothetical protein
MTATQEMNAAVARWINECADRPDGAAVLRKRAAWLEGLITKQGQGETVPALQDVTVWDSLSAMDRLSDAAAALEAK